MYQPAFAPSRISLSLKALHSALTGSICAAANASNAPASIRTQPHFALPESAALRLEGLHLRSLLLLSQRTSRISLSQKALHSALKGFICAATLAQP